MTRADQRKGARISPDFARGQPPHLHRCRQALLISRLVQYPSANDEKIRGVGREFPCRRPPDHGVRTPDHSSARINAHPLPGERLSAGRKRTRLVGKGPDGRMENRMDMSRAVQQLLKRAIRWEADT